MMIVSFLIAGVLMLISCNYVWVRYCGLLDYDFVIVSLGQVSMAGAFVLYCMILWYAWMVDHVN